MQCGIIFSLAQAIAFSLQKAASVEPQKAKHSKMNARTRDVLVWVPHRLPIHKSLFPPLPDGNCPLYSYPDFFFQWKLCHEHVSALPNILYADLSTVKYAIRGTCCCNLVLPSMGIYSYHQQHRSKKGYDARLCTEIFAGFVFSLA